ncbi:unnamed protein product [Pleuronectes platessa]|uniref:Uncharacterized protein n=1 Tax=Pleuronectes platessa TaxID=8262 RepID=A0A9N7UDC3_PLEPL|nr:unnamed protein product [Pleuronectes platessa]
MARGGEKVRGVLVQAKHGLTSRPTLSTSEGPSGWCGVMVGKDVVGEDVVNWKHEILSEFSQFCLRVEVTVSWVVDDPFRRRCTALFRLKICHCAHASLPQ